MDARGILLGAQIYSGTFIPDTSGHHWRSGLISGDAQTGHIQASVSHCKGLKYRDFTVHW